MPTPREELVDRAIDYLAEHFDRDPADVRALLDDGKTPVERIVDDLTGDPLGGGQPSAGPGNDPIRRAVHAATNTGI